MEATTATEPAKKVHVASLSMGVPWIILWSSIVVTACLFISSEVAAAAQFKDFLSLRMRDGLRAGEAYEFAKMYAIAGMQQLALCGVLCGLVCVIRVMKYCTRALIHAQAQS